ncbi:hypothetical protein GFM13_37470 [Rhizobium leguminosarum bv. viciae]|nr:hypothetical protein [Rhizobium leguminosarum bv. viciae]
MVKMKPKRFCVFCGEEPTSKTREHVVPFWLLEMTGDPKRVVTLGIDYTKDKAPISYAWQAFVAPACEGCNNTFSELEARVKPIIQALGERETLSVGQYDELLDWLDKVRIGVWLVRGMIEKNPIAVDPHFHITSRMGKKDRMLAVYVFKDQRPGINLFGNDSMISGSMPSCFGLRINDLLLLNVSSDFFCSRGCGLPHPQEMVHLRGGENDGMLSLQGVGYATDVSHPVTNLALAKPVVWLYQPIKHPVSSADFKGGYFGHTSPHDTRIMSRTLGGEGARGAIFRQWQDRVDVLSDPSAMIEFDEVVGDDCATAGEIAASVYDAQVSLFESIRTEWVPPAKPTDFDKLLRATKIESNREFANIYRGQGSKTPNS